MLLPQQVIPGLNSRDAHVREAACRYLESSSPKLLTADLCWALLDGSLPRPELNGWNILNGPQSAHSISRTLKAISSGQLFRDGPLDTAELVARLPLDVLEANRPQLDAHPAVSPKLRKQINRRIDRARAFEARPWERLEALATQNQDRSYSEMPDEVADLIHQIARHRPRAAAEAIERLNGPADSWVPIYAIDVLGRTRDEVAIEPLTKIAIDDFPTEDDATWEQVFFALSDIGTPAAIDALERLHHAGRPFQVNSALDALARIKRPDSEQALIRLADSAEDDMEATSLVIALAEIAATEPAAWAFVQGVVESRWDDLADDRYGLVLGFAPLVGWDAPELPAWRELHAAGAGRRKGLDKYRELFDRPAPPPNLPPPNDGQFVHVHAKVGRNDPCPCGSGKKYKKCCGV